MSKCVLKIKNIIPSMVLYFLRFQICIKKKNPSLESWQGHLPLPVTLLGTQKHQVNINIWVE